MITLRDDQDIVVESMRKNFRDGHIRQVLVCPTGFGKSIVMLFMTMAAIAKNKKVLFVCERRVLVAQFSDHLDSHGIEHGIFMAGTHKWRPECNVQVASAQTLEKMVSLPKFDIVFLDEVHVLLRKSIIKMIEANPSLKVVGATATPFNPSIPKYFTALSSNVPMCELVERKTLVPFRVFIAHEIDVTGVKVNAGEWNKSELDERGQKITGDVVSDYLRITNEVHDGIVKTICFSAGIAHGAKLEKEFNESGINAVQLASGVNADYKDDVMAEFAKPDSGIDMLISVDMLSRGLDVTDIRHVILARPLRKSLSQHIQMMGRGARAHPGTDLCVIQDHSGNYLRFRKEWDEYFNNGVTELGSCKEDKPKKEPTEREKEAAKCPKCGCVGNEEICPNCGYVRAKRNDVIVTPGEMQELKTNKSEAYDSAYKESFYQQLIKYRVDKGYKEGWEYWKYKDKFGINPPWKKVEADYISNDVYKFIISQNIKNAKRRK